MALHAGILGEVVDEILEVGGVEAGVSVGADLLFVGEDRDGGVGRGLTLCHVEVRDCGRIGADLIVMAVGADHAAVKADVHGLVCRDEFELGGLEIFFHDSVLLV